MKLDPNQLAWHSFKDSLVFQTEMALAKWLQNHKQRLIENLTILDLDPLVIQEKRKSEP